MIYRNLAGEKVSQLGFGAMRLPLKGEDVPGHARDARHGPGGGVFFHPDSRTWPRPRRNRRLRHWTGSADPPRTARPDMCGELLRQRSRARAGSGEGCWRLPPVGNSTPP